VFLLDTDICSEAVMGNPRVLERLGALDRDAWAMSSLVYAELQFGLDKGKLSTRSHTALEKFLLAAPLVPFDRGAAREAALVRFELEAQGRPSGAVDHFIAGHARYLEATLVTGNTAHFERVRGLVLENWRDIDG
jgi:tRNA(fMet)-specific endonuclease VapC